MDAVDQVVEPCQRAVVSQLPSFEVSVEPLTDGTRVGVSGELDVASATQLRDALESVEPAQRVLLDLSGVSFIDSTGLHLLLQISTLSRRDGDRLRIITSPEVDRVIALSDLADLLALDDGQD